MNVLIIEDNPDIAANVGDFLEDKGHIIDYAANGVAGQRMAEQSLFDIIILDLTLPGKDGIEVCKELKSKPNFNTAILMLTARDRLDQKLKGFETGADDYMVKPFELAELEARMIALNKRRTLSQARILEVADLIFNVATLDVKRNNQTIPLNPISVKLLKKLMEASPGVVQRRDLEIEIWGEEMPDSDSLRVHIHALRNAIDKPFNKTLIQTRHGIGYRISDPDEPQT